jgi:hypothetical protein
MIAPLIAVAMFGSTPNGVTASPDRLQSTAPAVLAPPADGVMGFLLTHLAPAIYNGADNCPHGPAGTLRENYVATLTDAERTRLLRKMNEQELTARWKAYALGPNGINICSHPQMFDRPMQKLLQGKIAQGMNLDGDAGDGSGNPNGCAHMNFTGPSGEGGVDNQIWRAMGCWGTWRGLDGNGGEIVHGARARFDGGQDAQVILLRGVDSLVQDDDVEVIYANTDDAPVVDAQGKFTRHASFTVAKDPAYRNVLRGRILNGVLTTEPANVLLRQRWGQGTPRDIRGLRTAYDFRHARLRMTFQPDGSLKGLVAAYQPFWNIIQSASLGGVGAATTGGIDCAGQYAALKAMADGDRDPATGQCTTISGAFEGIAVPAFVNDRIPTTKSAVRPLNFP